MTPQWKLEEWRREASDERRAEERASTMDPQTGFYGAECEDEFFEDEPEDQEIQELEE